MILVSCSSPIYWPDKFMHYHPDSFGIKIEEIKINSLKDKTLLTAWKIFSKKKKSAQNLILFFHGNAENLTSHFANLVWLAEEGFDIIIFDYRGYGLSEGTPYPRGVYEDGLTFLNYAYEQFKSSSSSSGSNYKKFIVYTQSLGGAVALRSLMDFDHRSEISLLVLDSTFRSAREVAREKTNWLLSWLISDSYTAPEDFSYLTMPILSLHAQVDHVIPYKLGEKLYNDIKHASKKEFWKISTPGHSAAFHVENGVYRKRFLDLVNGLDSSSF